MLRRIYQSMRNIFYFLLVVLSTMSCSTSNKLIGTWEEINYKKEHLTFDKNGTMFFDDMKGPIELKYEIVERSKDTIKFNVTVYHEGEEIKSALHSATFNTSDTVTMKNVDSPKVRSNTYQRLN